MANPDQSRANRVLETYGEPSNKARRRALVVAIIAMQVAGGCSSGRGGRSVAVALEDVIQLFRPATVEQVAKGSVDDISVVARRNEAIFDRSFGLEKFARAAADAEEKTDAEVRTFTSRLLSNFDDWTQRSAESKLKEMTCKMRLYAGNRSGDVRILDSWIDDHFAAIQIQLTQAGIAEVGEWIKEKVNDKTSLYSLACVAIARSKY
jgi:hypothetical protein